MWHFYPLRRPSCESWQHENIAVTYVYELLLLFPVVFSRMDTMHVQRVDASLEEDHLI